MSRTPGPWSYSSLKLYELCPRKFQAEKVTKEVAFTQNEKALYGEQLHKAAEEYVRDGKEIDPRFAFIKPQLDALLEKPGIKHCELRLGIKKSNGRLVACAFSDTEVWFRGIADLVILDGDLGWVVDYKTGDSKYADIRQLHLMAAALFLKYPELKKIRMGLTFVVDKKLIKETIKREEGLVIFGTLQPLLTALEISYKTDVWNPKRSGLCRKHCEVVGCPHRGE